MRAIFHREFNAHFTSLSGYLFCAFVLLFAGIYTMAYNLVGGYSNFEYVLSSMSFIFLIAVPVLTMRVIAEERHQKTDQLLYSLPLSTTQVVLGKYTALLTVLAVPVGIMCCYPPILSLYGEVNLLGAYSALVGFYLLGATLIAIGLFLSSVTESQGLAAGLCFGVMLLNFFLSGLADYVPSTSLGSFLSLLIPVLLIGLLLWMFTKSWLPALLTTGVLGGILGACYWLWHDSFAGLIGKILEHLSVFSRFDTFVSGVFDLTAILYFLTVIGLFLFFTIQSMEKRRWS